MLIDRHRVPSTAFTLLAAGHADAPTMRLLRAGQLSKHSLLVRAVLDAAGPLGREAAAARLDDAVRLLDEVQRQDPAAAAEVLGYPLVGAWAAHCLRRLRHPADRDVPLWIELAHLSSIAAAAGIRAGLSVEVGVPVRAGTVAVPTLGSASVVSGAEWGFATVRGRDRAYVVEGLHGSTPVPADPRRSGTNWSDLRRLVLTTDGRTLTVDLDDLDPYRDCHGLSATDRLDPGTVAAWRSSLQSAWELLVRDHAEAAEELASGPVTVVPLLGLAGNRHVNATARDSAGAMALTPPANPVALALSLVHEVQHSKLGALLDLVTLYDTGDDRRFYSPWRADPRPVGGLLQGAYAFLSVGRFWWRCVRRPTTTIPLPVAQYELARSRTQVHRALRTLAGSGTLTAPGERFVAGMRESVATLAAQPVPDRAASLAELVLDDHWLSWRLRNVRIPPDFIEDLAMAWRGSGRRPAQRPASWYATDRAPGYAEEPRHELVRRAVADPGVLDAGPDSALVAGDHDAAAGDYLRGIGAEPDRVDVWAGLAVARSRSGPQATGRAYATEPEVVRALYRRLRAAAGPPPDPDALAAWLAS